MSAFRSGLPAAFASALTSRETRDCQAVLAASEAVAKAMRSLHGTDMQVVASDGTEFVMIVMKQFPDVEG